MSTVICKLKHYVNYRTQVEIVAVVLYYAMLSFIETVTQCSEEIESEIFGNPITTLITITTVDNLHRHVKVCKNSIQSLQTFPDLVILAYISE